MIRRVGVLLSGCGLYDGSEVQETAMILLALDRAGALVEALAPDRPQLDVVDHSSTRVAEGESRNVLKESCRVVRGRVTPIDQARPEMLDALFLPGGYGAAKNWLSGFAEPGRGREPLPEVRSLLAHFLERRKPIGAVSLPQTLLSAMTGEPLREDPFSLPAAGVCVDEERNIVITPGFLASDRLSEVAAGIEKMVDEVLARAIPAKGKEGRAGIQGKTGR